MIRLLLKSSTTLVGLSGQAFWCHCFKLEVNQHSMFFFVVMHGLLLSTARNR
jgi:hypothetical protein